MEENRIVPSVEEVPPVARLHYQLTEQDYYNCMKSGHLFRHSGTRAWVETAVLTLIGAGYLFSYMFDAKESMNLIMAIVCAAVIAAIWLLPEYSIRAAAKQQVNQKMYRIVVWHDRIEIGQGDGFWCIELNGTASFWETDTLFVLEDTEQRMTPLPKREMDENIQSAVRTALQNGTQSGVPKRRRK